ncbi:hypothetical protein [Lentibacillus amyloliquefaciens]|uniref:hypothetical protein n=1 Tax=Lentibacillus amyloliquefaciens TaxID=1472767 RepID=UPI0014700885|nr:hypothetical protein [Lentibacillus amyloliquefaciens]
MFKGGVQIRRFIYYFAWTIGIGFIIYLGMRYQIRLEEEAKKNFELLPVVLFATLFPIVIGLFLRVPKLIIEMKQDKQWGFDWVKFIAIALPSLYIITFSILSYTPLGKNFTWLPDIIIFSSPTIQVIAGVVLGYTFLDSLMKE